MPLLMATLLSPTETQQSSTSTFPVESGSIPSSFAIPSSRGAETLTWPM